MAKYPWQNCVLMSLTLSILACHREGTPSESKQIFLDQQRYLVEPTQAPFIISVNAGCTGFILDTAKKIAVSAQHCGVTQASQICFLQSRLRGDDWKISSCQYEGAVAEIIEASPVAELDYVIFRYEFTKTEPKGLRSVRLAKQDFLQTLHKDQRRLKMLGYPGDAYQRTRLTSSSCLVRDPSISTLASQTPPEAQQASDAIIKAWEDDKRYSGRDDYRDMREACFFIASSHLKLRPTFKEDCSVYGGNSGGPILIENSQIVIGMPASYYPQPDPNRKVNLSVANTCYDKYWDVYFQPYWGQRPAPSVQDQSVEIARGKIWDKLDRQSSDLSDFPTAIPMHLVVESSKFLRTNQQYLADQLISD